MHEMAKNILRDAGFIVPEPFDSSSVTATLDGVVREIEVKFHTSIPGYGGLVFPVKPREYRILMETVFSTMEG